MAGPRHDALHQRADPEGVPIGGYSSRGTERPGTESAGLRRQRAGALRRLRLLDENEKVNARLLALLEDVDCGGKQVHDASIVATMLAHGVDTLVTANVEDFTRFEKLITVRKL